MGERSINKTTPEDTRDHTSPSSYEKAFHWICALTNCYYNLHWDQTINQTPPGILQSKGKLSWHTTVFIWRQSSISPWKKTRLQHWEFCMFWSVSIKQIPSKWLITLWVVSMNSRTIAVKSNVPIAVMLFLPKSAKNKTENWNNWLHQDNRSTFKFRMPHVLSL